MTGEPPLAWQINGERLLLLSWGPAVLMQLAHPLVAAGVAEHSTFRGSAQERLGRFRRTLRAMLRLTYGSPEDARAIADRINRIHDRVHGRLLEATGVFPAGTPYSARDPALLCWVHATLLDCTLRTYALLFRPLSQAERDRYCAEATGLGPLLGIPEELLPHDEAQLQAYLERMLASGQIAVGATARRLARDLLAPHEGPAALLDLPVRLPGQLLTVGLLPPAIRRAYGFRWTGAYRAAFLATVAAVRRMVPLLPDVVRRWPEARAAISRTAQAAA